MAAYDEPQHDPVSPPPDIRGLSDEEAIETVKDWFLQNFEDPAYCTPYNSREGGYLYIWGGPYDARDIIESFYGSDAPDALKDEIVSEIEVESSDWVPSSSRRQQAEEDWLDLRGPILDPYLMYLSSYEQLQKLLFSQGSENGFDLINRLIFAHHITALEAYLGDTLLRAVMKDRDAMMRMVGGNKDISTTKYSLGAILSNPNLVEDQLKHYLKSVVYHDLRKVDALYELALNVKVLDTNVDADNGALIRAVELRHDCVHRNGLSKDRKPQEVFTRKYVEGIAEQVRDLVERLEKQINSDAEDADF